MINKFMQIIKKITRRSVYVSVKELPPGNLLVGKKIVITGGGSGIGYEIAKKAFQQGADVVICGRNLEKLELASKKIGSDINGRKVKTLQWDVRDIKRVEEIITSSESLLGGRINTFVSNAGIYKTLNSETVREKDYEEIFGTNFKAPYFILNQMAIYMKNNHVTGNIIAITSETAESAYTNPYGLSKCALSKFIQGLAFDYASVGIRCNAVSPGITISEINNKNLNGDVSNDTFMGRYLLPEEIASTVIFLISDLSACINGEIITCNGGNTIPIEYHRH